MDTAAGSIKPGQRNVPENEKIARKIYTGAMPSGAI
jgi:hypothetical protein